VHFTPAGRQVHPGDIVTTIVTDAAPHHLIADGEIITHRRTRAGDAYADGQRRSGVGLGMPGVGQPVSAAEPLGCTR
jgi:tRNA-2-methylthio-N6-dimethylallyladenosine synthase